MQFLQFDYFSRENCLVTEKFTFLVDLRSKFQFCDVVGLYSLLAVMILKSTTTKFHWLHSNPLFVSRKWFLLGCFGSHFVGNTQQFLAADLQIEGNTRWANMPQWKWPKWWKRSRPLVPIWWSIQHRCQVQYRNLLHSLDCIPDCTQDCRNPKGYTELNSLVIWIFAPKNEISYVRFAKENSWDLFRNFMNWKSGFRIVIQALVMSVCHDGKWRIKIRLPNTLCLS